MEFSIIIPTFNRCEPLSRTLKSIIDLDYPADEFETIVVDNGSSDRTREVFDAARATARGHTFRYFNEPMPGLLSGRHRGAAESHGEICAFLDDDVRVVKDWLNALEDALADSVVALVGGRSVPIFEADAPDWLSEFYQEDEHGRYCSSLSLFDGGEKPKEVEPRFVWGLNYVIRKSVLFELGGFHPDCMPKKLQRYQGDGESGLSSKLMASAWKSVYHPQACVHHEVPKSRLTPEYLQARARYQGVCDSYTEIRRNGWIPEGEKPWKLAARLARKTFRKATQSFGSAVTMHERTKQAYAEGRHFHRREVASDTLLLDWVMKPNYWNYNLPQGWEQWMARDARAHPMR